MSITTNLNTYNCNNFTLILSLFSLFIFSSCVKQEEEQQKIKLEIEKVGHQYIYLKTTNKVDYNYFHTANLYYDTVEINTDSSPFLEYETDYTSSHTVKNLKPGKGYYFNAKHQDTKSNNQFAETLPAVFSCQPSVTTVIGDRSANQSGFSHLLVRTDRLEATLNGDFLEFELYLPKQTFTGGFLEGIYTTVNNYQGDSKFRNPHTAIVTFTAFRDTVYYAKMDQPISVTKPTDFSSAFVVDFCDMVFVNTVTGQEVTLSGKLR